MHARLGRYEIDPDKLDDAIASFREAGRELASLDGYMGGHLLVDGDSGALLTLTFWENRRALDTSEVRAASLRQQALKVVAGDVQSVSRFEALGLEEG